MTEVVPGVFQLQNTFVNHYLIVEPDGLTLIDAGIAGDSLNTTGGTLKFVDGPVTWNYQRGAQSVRDQAALGAEWVCCGHGPVVRVPPGAFPVLSA